MLFGAIYRYAYIGGNQALPDICYQFFVNQTEFYPFILVLDVAGCGVIDQPVCLCHFNFLYGVYLKRAGFSFK